MRLSLRGSWLVSGVVATFVAACTTPKAGELEPRYVAVHNALAAMGLAQVGPIQQGSLAEGRESKLRLDLAAGCTTIVAIGGPGVRDLDVSLLDADDKPVARDTTKEPQATLRTCPEAGGRFSLVVKMAAGAGDFMAATWSGGAGGPLPGPASSSTALASAGNGTCESPFLLAPGAMSGNTRRGESEHAGSCANTESKELVYKLEVPRRQRVTLETDPQFDSVVYVRKDECADTENEVACNDDMASGSKRGSASSSKGSRIDEVLEAGTYFVFVDGYNNDAGQFRMTTSITDVPTLADACRNVRPLGGTKTTATLAGGFDHAHASCGSDAKGPDALHRFDLAARSRVRIVEHSSEFAPALHLRKVCTDEHSEVGCSDSGMTDEDAAWAGVLDPGAYVLFADSSDKDARGRYTLETETDPEAGSGTRGDACGDALPINLADRTFDGDTFTAHDDVAGKCGGQGAPDVVYRFELTKRSRVVGRMTTEEGSHVLVLLRSCADRSSEIACSNVIDEMLNPGVYFLAVDGKTKDAMGRYTFQLTARDVTAQETACRAPGTLVDGQTIQGTTAGQGDKFSTSCAGPEDRQGSADRVYKITLAQKLRVKLQLSTPSWDGVLALRKACIDPPRATNLRANEAGCNNDFQDSHHSKIETTLDPGTYFVIVDGHQARNEGAFTLEYKTSKP